MTELKLYFKIGDFIWPEKTKLSSFNVFKTFEWQIPLKRFETSIISRQSSYDRVEENEAGNNYLGYHYLLGKTSNVPIIFLNGFSLILKFITMSVRQVYDVCHTVKPGVIQFFLLTLEIQVSMALGPFQELPCREMNCLAGKLCYNYFLFCRWNNFDVPASAASEFMLLVCYSESSVYRHIHVPVLYTHTYIVF